MKKAFYLIISFSLLFTMSGIAAGTGSVNFSSTGTNPCSVTIIQDLSFTIPNAIYDAGPPVGQMALSVDFQFFGEQNGQLLWQLSNVDTSPSSGSCPISIAPDLSFTLTNAIYYGGPLVGQIALQAEFEYFGEQAGSLLWHLADLKITNDPPVIPPSDLQLDKTQITLQVGESETVTISGGSGFYKSAYSSNVSVANVTLGTNTITVLGVSQGMSTITVADSSNNIANLPVTVKSSMDNELFSNLASGWEPSLIFDHKLNYPHSFLIGPDGDAFVYDTAKNAIFKISQDNYAISEYKNLTGYFEPNTPEGIGCIAWQPQAKRFLLGTQKGQIWSYDQSSDELNILSSGVPGYYMGWTNIEVNPFDGSFFVSSACQNGNIYRFNADMTTDLIVSGTQGAYQKVYVKNENALYYTETYSGTLKKVDLISLEIKTIIPSVGIPKTFEPIGITMNSNTGIINVFSPPNGLMDVNGNQIMHPNAGGGAIHWWDAVGDKGGIVLLQGAGANLVHLDPKLGYTTPVTQYVNATQIARNKKGDVLINSPFQPGSASDISKVDADGISDYYHDSAASLRVLMNDTNGNVYAAWSNGKINIITGPGTDNAQPWADGVTNIISMAHNSFSDKISVLRESNSQSVEIVNLEINDPTSKTILAKLQRADNVPNVANIVCGPDGSTYVSFLGMSEPGITTVQRFDLQGNPYPPMLIEADIWDGNNFYNSLSAMVYSKKIPGLIYVRNTDLLLASTQENIDAYTGGDSVLPFYVFGKSNGSVDILTMTEDKDGNVVGMHSGRVFQFEKKLK